MINLGYFYDSSIIIINIGAFKNLSCHPFFWVQFLLFYCQKVSPPDFSIKLCSIIDNCGILIETLNK